MDKQEVIDLRVALQHELNLISEKLGYKLTLGSCRFGITADFKLEAAPLTTDGEAVSKIAEQFKQGAHLFDLKKEWYDKEFTGPDGRVFVIVGLDVKKKKYPVIAERLYDKKRFKFPPAYIIKQMEGKKK